MNPITAAFIGLVAGMLIQAWRTARKLKCSMWNTIKSGGGPGNEEPGP